MWGASACPRTTPSSSSSRAPRAAPNFLMQWRSAATWSWRASEVLHPPHLHEHMRLPSHRLARGVSPTERQRPHSGLTNLVCLLGASVSLQLKCKGCDRQHDITIQPFDAGNEWLPDKDEWQRLATFECRGIDPVCPQCVFLRGFWAPHVESWWSCQLACALLLRCGCPFAVLHSHPGRWIAKCATVSSLRPRTGPRMMTVSCCTCGTVTRVHAVLYSVCCHCARISACIVSAALFFRLCSPLPSVALWHWQVHSVCCTVLASLHPAPQRCIVAHEQTVADGAW